MSTIDYLEFKNYLEHGLFDKKKKQYYKNEATTAVKLPVGTIALPRDKVEEGLKSGKLSTDQIYRGAYSNRASGKAVYQKRAFESDEDYKKRIKKYAVDVGQARHNVVKSYNSQLQAKKDLERAEKRMPYIKKVKDSSSALIEAYSVWNNAKKDLAKAGGNVSATTVLKKKIEDARKDIVNKSDDLDSALTFLKATSLRSLFTDDEKEAAAKLRDEYNQSTKTFGEYTAKKAAELFHDNLEHSWFTDLFKPKHQNEAKGSRAGMPSNIPTMSNKHGNAVAKRDSYADQVKRLTANLSDYQAKEAKAKQEYEFYRKKADEVRKAIKEAERYRDAAAKEALTTPEVNTTVTSAPPKYIRLPEGSKAGMPSNIKKKRR